MRIALATALAAIVATAVDYVIQEATRSLFAIPVEFAPFQGTVIPYTIGGIVLAAIAYVVVQRFARDPRRAYMRLAIVALVLSWIPDVALLLINEPGATVAGVAALMLMHAVAAVTIVGALLALDRVA
jgi:hypothetical protein